MTVGSTPRLGLTTWTSDQDQVNRGQFVGSIGALDIQVARDIQDLESKLASYANIDGTWFTSAMNWQGFCADNAASVSHYVNAGSGWTPVMSRIDQTIQGASISTLASSYGTAGYNGKWFYGTGDGSVGRGNGASVIQVFTTATVPAAQPPPVGTIITLLPSASVNASSSTWLPCNGQAVASATYSTLFSLIGTQYGSSGASFNLPNVKGYQGNQPYPISTPLGFSYTGAVQYWTVPPGVTSITMTLTGAAGGNAVAQTYISGSPAGGLGGVVTFTITVVPGHILAIYVGQQGLTPTDEAAAGAGGWGYASGGAGGENGLGGSSGWPQGPGGPGGGGSTAIYDTTSSTLLAVAGAGGGAAGPAVGTSYGGYYEAAPGGNGGNPNGANGQLAFSSFGGIESPPPGGATQSVAGAGGGVGGGGGSAAGSAGSGPGITGTGGAAQQYQGGWTGGGGAGYYGGGGGGWAEGGSEGAIMAESGGGGSSWVIGSATVVSYGLASTQANGSVSSTSTSTPTSLYPAYIRAK